MLENNIRGSPVCFGDVVQRFFPMSFQSGKNLLQMRDVAAQAVRQSASFQRVGKIQRAVNVEGGTVFNLQGLQKQLPKFVRASAAHLVHGFLRTSALLVAVGGDETRSLHFLQMVIDRGQLDLSKVLQLLLYQLFDLIAVLGAEPQKKPATTRISNSS